MTKKIAAVFLALALAGSINPEALREANLVGKVKTVVEENYSLINQSGAWVRGFLNYKYVNTYDSKGNRTEWESYGAAGLLKYLYVYAYDDKGNQIEETYYNGDGSLASKSVYAYEYDSDGNWVKQTESKEFSRFGKAYFEPSRICIRTITYYK